MDNNNVLSINALPKAKQKENHLSSFKHTSVYYGKDSMHQIYGF
jgi:hypothetical protein